MWSYLKNNTKIFITVNSLAVLSIYFLVGCLKIGQTQKIENEMTAYPAQTREIIITSTLTPTPTSEDSTRIIVVTTQPLPDSSPAPTSLHPQVKGASRGYMTSPQELANIKKNADEGIEPYLSAVNNVIEWSERRWNFKLGAYQECRSADRPDWIDNQKGIPILYSKALAYHLTGEVRYAEEVKDILQRIMSEVKSISVDDPQCRLNFGWGTPELVMSADLIEDFWKDKICTGPVSTLYGNIVTDSGDCKFLFQNWLIKNPYFVVSHSAAASKSNWGAAATNATAYIADYLWDRPDVLLVHRYPEEINGGESISRSPAEAYEYANQLALDRMNGHGVEHGSSNSCDYLDGSQQNDRWEPVKSQISENGIIPEDARREEYCNIQQYNGEYQNYPQIHLGNNIQQCELMFRRGDRSCYDNVDSSDIPNYTFVGPDGELKTTHLYPGRGSIKRAINAIIIDSNTEWRHDSALEVAYRYYSVFHNLGDVDPWLKELDSRPTDCAQDVCFGTLSHGFGRGEVPQLPPIVSPP